MWEWNHSSIFKGQRCNHWSVGMHKSFHPMYNLSAFIKWWMRGKKRPISLTIISAWISNHMPIVGWNYLSNPHFKGCTIGDWEWISNFINIFDACNYLSMLVLKLIHIDNRGPWYQTHRHSLDSYGFATQWEDIIWHLCHAHLKCRYQLYF